MEHVLLEKLKNLLKDYSDTTGIIVKEVEIDPKLLKTESGAVRVLEYEVSILITKP
jgi:hypothetical protein